MLLENLPLFVHCLHASCRLEGFLHETVSRLTSDLPLHQVLLRAYLKGVGVALAEEKEGSELCHCLSQSVGSVTLAVSAGVERLRQNTACSVSTLLTFLHSDSIWTELAQCLALTPSQVRR